MKKNGLTLFLQSILFVCVIISLIISLFLNIFLTVTYALITLLMFIMCYNNYVVYKRKYFSIIYLLFGLIFLVEMIVGVINGI